MPVVLAIVLVVVFVGENNVVPGFIDVLLTPKVVRLVALVNTLVVVGVFAGVVVVGTAMVDGIIVFTAWHPAAPTTSKSNELVVKSVKLSMNT